VVAIRIADWLVPVVNHDNERLDLIGLDNITLRTGVTNFRQRKLWHDV